MPQGNEGVETNPYLISFFRIALKHNKVNIFDNYSPKIQQNLTFKYKEHIIIAEPK